MKRVFSRTVLSMVCILLVSCAENRHIRTAISAFSGREEHPALLFTTEEIPTIRSRVTREPYGSWWKWVKQQADNVLATSTVETMAERRKSECAKALAFVFRMTEDAAYASKAKGVLESSVPVADGGDWGDIHTEVETARNYCQAYDMLASYLEDFADSHRRIRAGLYREGHRLYTYSSVKETANNWRIRRCAALGLCALAIADYGEGEEGTGPRDWHARAVKGITQTIDYQATSDGGYAEGPNYLRYSADLYVPFLMALHRATGQNLFEVDPLRSVHEWGVKIRLPNGQRPNFDDAALDSFYGGLFARLSSAPSLHQWDWLNSEGGPHCPGFMKIDAICAFDDAIDAEPPEWNPTVIFPEAGTAVFRSDWSSEAIYMLLLGEHGAVRVHGGAHDQPDPLSFIIHAYGEMLAIDSGYIKWKERHKVNKPTNHNLILVDGQGPSAPKWFFGWHGGTDAYLQNSFATDFMDYAEVRTHYRGADVVRHVLFPRHRYFVVIDEIQSQTERHYTWLLHGNGLSSEGTFALTEKGGTWTQNGVSLHAHITAPSGVEVSERQDVHSFRYGEENSHSLIAADVEADNTKYISILYPRRESDPVPVISSLACEGLNGAKVQLDNSAGLILTQNGEKALSVSDAVTGCGSVRTDARISLVSFDDGAVSQVVCTEGTFFEHDGQAIYMCETRINIAVRRGDGGIDGCVKGTHRYDLQLMWGRQPTAALFRNSPVDFHYESGKTIVYLEGEGDIRLEW